MSKLEEKQIIEKLNKRLIREWAESERKDSIALNQAYSALRKSKNK